VFGTPSSEIARNFLAAVLAQPKVKPLLSSEHFPMDATLIEAWESIKRFRRKDGKDEGGGPGRDGERDFHGGEGGNDEMDEACGDEWAELPPDGSIIGQICFRAAPKRTSTRAPGSLLQQPARDEGFFSRVVEALACHQGDL
jgi:hypothetical protein